MIFDSSNTMQAWKRILFLPIQTASIGFHFLLTIVMAEVPLPALRLQAGHSSLERKIFVLSIKDNIVVLSTYHSRYS